MKAVCLMKKSKRLGEVVETDRTVVPEENLTEGRKIYHWCPHRKYCDNFTTCGGTAYSPCFGLQPLKEDEEPVEAYEKPTEV